ncbi:xanthine dehydrogenase [Nasonia vitripennis]|uniref:Indole-3-acetaldehyde oxidase n=1 Tax=Nasonia vitripennis TaxID=7425 RepID=A0A7M7HAK7_NASVI|nr:xanthine dehydrogenase [Nasonia vitripennis]
MGQGESTLTHESLSELKLIEDDDMNVQVTINNIMYKVSPEVPSGTSLNTFIRDYAKLKGTKAMCHEGGCGSCIVAAEMNGHLMSVNSCLVPIFICDGWKITTIEGLGNKQVGYHTLQAALAEMNGSQCGFCSGGWIMNMHSLIQNGKMTMKEIENSFASNICRCTGYRPILDTFKSFASDAPPAMKDQIKDIEDLHNVRKSCTNCPKKTCKGTCQDLEIIYKSSIPRSLELELHDSVKFHKVLDIEGIFAVFEKHPNSTYVMNGGNTAHGVYRLKKRQVYIDINNVADLHKIEKTKESLILGANVTLSMMKATCEKYMTEPGFEYLKKLARHIDLVASIPIRNIGTIAGNLMIKNQYHEFPSDIFLILETAGAQVHVLDLPGSKNSLNLREFLQIKMNKKILYSIVIPALGKEYMYKSYKVMPRAQNAHALVNAGFLFKLDNTGKVLEKPNILFGGIRPDFLHASNTEQYLLDKNLFNAKVMEKALSTLYSELNPDHVLPDYSPEFRRLLAVGLLYKYILNLNPNKASPRIKSGGTLLQRELSSGKQEFNTDRTTWPVNEPINKIGAIHQTSGEGEYINDIIIRNDEVFCALTLAEAPGTIEKIDFEGTMEIDGVIAYFTAKDIPGKNTFINSMHKYLFLEIDEELFADKEVMYAGQPYGMIVAKTQNIAQYAASKVKIVYPNGPRRKPMITVHDVIASNDKTRIMKVVDWPAKQPAGNDVKHKIEGTVQCGPQYHFSMETQTCVCVPIEDGMDVYSSTQWMDLNQTNIAAVLAVPINSINLKVRRLGGSYGCKISRSCLAACACALACHKLNRPARLVMSIEDNMRSIGKRVPAYMEYEVSTNDEGKIQQLNGTYYGNVGCSFNETHSIVAIYHFYNCYDPASWNMIGNDVKTDLPSNTWCRAPGAAEGVAMVEQIMEKIARITGKDPLDIRMINMNDADKAILTPMIDELKKSSDYEKRVKDVDKFNSENRWKKRGISLVPMKYPFSVYGQFHSLVSIYARDGTVSISHAGIEMGQGLHTKVAQVAAYTLGIDLKMISVKPSTNLTTPNSYVTGGSLGSDVCGYATQQACKILLERLKPIKEMLGGNPSWQELILTAHAKNVDLCASFMFTAEQDIKSYPVYGATVSEVEIDVLTGQHLIRRVDILEDTGVSLSPKIDIGQVEGAFIMGIGYWTCEDLIYDPETGALTNYRTWNYKVPGAKDIPIDFRVSFGRNTPNPLGILRSKTTGEPPFCMSCSVPIAIRHAIDSARADAGNKDHWYQLDNAVTVEKILLNCLTSVDAMMF